jgi:DNA ligase-4
MNFRIKHHGPVDPKDKEAMGSLLYTHELFNGVPQPMTYFREPLLAEIYGGGFTKERGCKYYYPRFPRITKLHRLSERSWKSGLSLQELHVIARKSVGRDRSMKDVEDWGKAVWGKANQISPKVRDSSELERRERRWLRNLEISEGIHHGELSPIPSKKRKRLDPISEEISTDLSSKACDSEIPTTPSQQATPKGRPLPSSPLSPCLNTRREADGDVTPRPQKKGRFLSGTEPFTSPKHLISRANLPSPATSPMKTTSTRIAHPKTQFFPARSQHRDDKATPSPPAAADEASQSLLEPPKLTAVYNTLEGAQDSTIKKNEKRTVIHRPPCRITTPGEQPLLSVLLETSFVWSPPQLDKHLQRALSVIACADQRLHARFALWFGCGWDTSSKVPSWVESGIVFVDSESLEQEVISECEKRVDVPEARKTVYVIAAGILDLVTIAGSADVEVEEYLLAVIE